MDIKAALEAFEALSQETRLETLRLLVRAGDAGMPAGEIAEALGCRQNTLSTHLKILAAADLAVSRRDGRSIIYRANYGSLRELIVYLMEDCCAGNADVCRPIARSLASATV